MARTLIANGYQQQARKAHPDMGGSTDAMLRLTTVRDALLAIAEHLSDEALMGRSFAPDYRGEWDRNGTIRDSFAGKRKRNIKKA